MAWIRLMWNRQFNEYSSDDNYHWEIQLPRFALRITGMWSEAKKTDRMRFFIIMATIFVVDFLRKFIFLFSIEDDSMGLFSSITDACMHLLAITSIIYSRFASEICQSIFEEMRENWGTNSSEENRKIMHRYAGCSRKIASIVAAIKVSDLIFFSLSSLVQGIINEGNLTTKLDGACYPFSSSNLFFLASCCAYDYIASYGYLLRLIGMDSCIMVFSLHACAQLIILGNRIKMYEGKIRHSSEETPSDCSCLKCIVDSHVRICKFVGKINEYLHIHIFTRIVWSVVSFGFMGSDVVKAINDKTDYATVTSDIVFVLQVIATLFLYCWSAEICQQRSYALGDIAYDTEWMTKEPKISRHLTFIIHQARIPLKITGAKYFTLSLNFFREIMMTGMSYLSLLVTVKLR